MTKEEIYDFYCKCFLREGQLYNGDIYLITNVDICERRKDYIVLTGIIVLIYDGVESSIKHSCYLSIPIDYWKRCEENKQKLCADDTETDTNIGGYLYIKELEASEKLLREL